MKHIKLFEQHSALNENNEIVEWWNRLTPEFRKELIDHYNKEYNKIDHTKDYDEQNDEAKVLIDAIWDHGQDS